MGCKKIALIHGHTAWHIALAVGASVFFIGSTVLWTLGSHTQFVSPDETANRLFIEQFSKTGRFGIFDPINQELDDRVHPRSTVSLNGWIVPVGFLGLPSLYGSLARAFGAWILPFVTPLLAVLAIFAFRFLIGMWFDARLANLTAIVLFFHPAFWYYSARFLMPNMLFVALVVFAAFFWFARPFEHRLWPVLSGLFLGLAVFVRASEVYWLFFVVLGLVAWFWRTIEKKDFVAFLLGGLFGILPFFVMNTLTYGDPLLTGYTLPLSAESAATNQADGRVDTWLFPLGLDARAAVRHVFDYGLALFWWLTIPAIIGFFSWDMKRKTYLTIFCALAVWLGVWYGSWVIHDNPDPTQVTIANSYVRYWLPIFWLSAPLVARGLLWIHERGKRKVLPVLIGAMIWFGLQLTFFAGQDGLMSSARLLRRSEEIRASVLSIIEPDSVIIVDRADKLFVPHRVMYPLRDERTYELMPRVVERVGLYYYGITLPQQDLDYLNERKLKQIGLHIEPLDTFDQESLYKIY